MLHIIPLSDILAVEEGFAMEMETKQETQARFVKLWRLEQAERKEKEIEKWRLERKQIWERRAEEKRAIKLAESKLVAIHPNIHIECPVCSSELSDTQDRCTNCGQKIIVAKHKEEL